MILVVLALFNAVRQTVIIFLCLPLATIGVAAGLLFFREPFGFMCLLGFIGLSGMLIKNAVVLIDQIDLEIRQGKDPYIAVLDSSVSRLRPVTMAAVTTVLGMLPLVADAFFSGMSVTIMTGLSFGTILTLVVVPLFYTIFFKIQPEKGQILTIE
jgi:multidrug efflux pump subunit AcrB